LFFFFNYSFLFITTPIKIKFINIRSHTVIVLRRVRCQNILSVTHTTKNI